MTINNTNINATEVKEGTTMTEKKVTKVLDIDRKFVEEFAKNASVSDVMWIISKTEELVKEKGEKKYFAAFRTEFAKKFMPEIFAEKKPIKKPSMLDNINKILAEKVASNAA